MSDGAFPRATYPTRTVRIAADDWSDPQKRADIIKTARDDAKIINGRILVKVKLCGRLQTMFDVAYVPGRNGYNIKRRL